MNKHTVTINGTVYDKQTGLPLRSAESAPRTNSSHAGVVHQRTQKSTTLHRAYVKREHAQRSAHQPASPAVSPATKHVVNRSPLIQKYAPHPTPHAKPQTAPIEPAVSHPVAVRAAAKAPSAKRRPHQNVQQSTIPAPSPQTRTHKPSDIIKAEATQKAFAEAPTHNRPQHRNRSKAKSKLMRSHKQRAARFMSLATSGFAMLMIAGYFTYVNMPSLSVRVAAVQAGVDASYPNYRPSGYSLSGPVAYDDGNVRMAFTGHGTNQGFTLSQTKSGWDSSAVLDNYVEPKAGSEYLTTTEGGLTIYSWGGNAAWVSKGILYTIDGDAPLAPEQVHRLAMSM